MGNGLDPKNLIGPVSNKMQFDKVRRLRGRRTRPGARIVVGGNPDKRSGYFYPLTVIADATDAMRVVKEEQFGPVIPIVNTTVEEAISAPTHWKSGLGGSVWGNDVGGSARLPARLECGTAWVNQHGTLHPMAPFGGVKSSGIGVEFNVDGLKEYTTVQVVNLRLVACPRLSTGACGLIGAPSSWVSSARRYSSSNPVLCRAWCSSWVR